MEGLINKLKRYSDKNIIPMHMPGGKRNSKVISMPEPFSIDITEIEDFDNLHSPEAVLKYEEERAADIYGADESLICVNGASSAIFSAICGAFEKGDKVLVARNSHISIINAIVLRELNPVFLYPDIDEAGICSRISLDLVKLCVEEHADIKAFIISSPTYEGLVSDIREIANYLHERNIILIADEAHGAHFAFSSYFPESAVRVGADIVINSLHKTLPALTQTALLHLNGPLINKDRIRSFWDISQTTSPSYVLMGSISACFDFLLSKEGHSRINEYLKHLKILRSKCLELKNISLFPSDDPGKLTLKTSDGKGLYDYLLDKHKIQLEMASLRYVIAMTSVADDFKHYELFFEALKETDSIFEKSADEKALFFKDFSRHTQYIPVFEAFEMRFKSGNFVDVDSAEGLVSLDNIIIYPPGIPLVISGEEIKSCDIKIIREALSKGLAVLGIKNNKILVVEF